MALVCERTPVGRLLAVLVAFVGVLVVIRPGSDVFHSCSRSASLGGLAHYLVGHALGYAQANVLASFMSGRRWAP